ncbi:alkaline phosphatase family protein [bacterium]|nr:alkaline phosphatase family protein [bacterium]
MNDIAYRFSKIFIIFFSIFFRTIYSAPQLSIIFVVDQFAHHYLNQIKPHLNGGLKFLLNNGIVYENAYFPHAMPATATGHAALSTGCFAKDHGIIANGWYSPDGKKIKCSDDTSAHAAVFAQDGSYKPYGKSSQHLMVETISDQTVLYQQNSTAQKVFSISYKSRASILTAGKLGKAIWFDNGDFTTSKAYFKKLPSWIKNFNAQKNINASKTITWKHAYKKNSKAYNFVKNDHYENTTFQKSIIDTPLPLVDFSNKKKPYQLMIMTPYANQLLLDLALECINQNMTKNNQDKFVLWISLSALDKVGHHFGPNSTEAIDMLYHLDNQLKSFIKKVEKKANKKNILFALTADHGVTPIPEYCQKKGISTAKRIDENNLIQRANNFIEKKHSISNIISAYKTPQFYFDTKKLATLDKKTKKQIQKDLITFFTNEPGIKRAWTKKELLHSTFEPTDIKSFYKNQIYQDRSGDLIIQLDPFCQTTKYKHGAAHRTPYEHNTHVPLIFYQKGIFEKKQITKRVSMMQFANSFAQILQVPKPPASTFCVFPKLFD